MTESQQDMKFEHARLTTFQSWPSNAKVEAWKMAKAGLFHTGQNEEVKCTWCGCVFNNWQYGDQVMAKHRMASPSCLFVQNQSDNVPLIPTTAAVAVHENNSNNTGTGTEDVDDSSVMMETDHSPTSPRRPTANPPEPSPELKSEAIRLSTFSSWPIVFMSPVELARAGFYYLGRGDSCRCAFCGSYVGDWVEGDEPMAEHLNLFPMCPYVRGLEVGNVEIGAELQAPAHQSNDDPGHDETGLRWMPAHRSPNAGPEKGNGLPNNLMSKVGQVSGKEENIGIIKHTGPLHPNYATLEARLRTFREWPPALKQQPQELAEAGFYYIGLSDQVKCFYCDGGLRNWQPEDVPWMEHSRWFSKCVFVRLVKGDDFVSKCLVEKPPETKPGVPVARTTHDKPLRSVTEDDVRAMMSQAVVHQVLSMGIDASRVKMAIKRRLELNGSAFESAEHLINAAFSVQREQVARSEIENRGSSSAFLRTPEESQANLIRQQRQEESQSQANQIRQQRQEESQANQIRQEELQARQEMFDEVTERMEASVTSLVIDPSTEEDELQSQVEAFVSPAPLNPLPPVPSSSGPQSLPTTPAVSSPISPPPSETCISLPLPEHPPSQPASLEDENARLKEQRTCKICMDGEVGVVFLPCGHFCCCVNCAPSLKDCPVCRTSIQGTVRTYMS